MEKSIETQFRDKHFDAFIEWYKGWQKSPLSNGRYFEGRAKLAQGVMSKYTSGTYRPRMKTLNRCIKVAIELGMPENYLADYQVKKKKSKK